MPGSRTISATMHSKLQGWVGFGWHCAEPSCNQDTQMFNVDFVVGLLIGGSWVATDQVSEQGKQTGPPVLDTARCEPICGQDNILAYEGFQNESGTWVSWVRKLETGDLIADHNISLAVPMRVIYAWGDSNTFQFHGGRRGQQTIFFCPDFCDINSTSLNCTSAPPPSGKTNLRYWHGCLMFFAYGVLFTLAIIVARYMKHHTWWFPVHWGVILTACCMILAAFIMIIVEVGSTGTPQFQIARGKLGLATVAMTFITVFLGAYSHFTWDP